MPGSLNRWFAKANMLFTKFSRPFCTLNPAPASQSFEALRQAVPTSARVYLTAGLERLSKLRVASALAHTQLLGTIDSARLHLLPNIPIEPVGRSDPDIVIVARDLSLGLADHGYPTVWWDSNAIAYLTSELITPAINPPPAVAPDFFVRLSDIRTEANHISFAAAFTDHNPDGWTGPRLARDSAGGHAMDTADPL